jgi:tetratricopeptide (TPR) repeat protein
MRCPRCASDNPDGAKFCIECGTPLTPRCPQCGGDTLPRAKFSGECGTPLTAQTPAPPSGPPQSPLWYTPGHFGEPWSMLDNLRAAETLAEALHDQRRLGQVYSHLSHYFWVVSDQDRALEYSQRALPIGAALGDVALQVHTNEEAVQRAASTGRVGQSFRLVYLSEAYLLAGRMDSALELAVRALTLSREQREQGHEVYALRLLGDIAAHRDPPKDEQADASYRQALALAEALGMRPLVAHCHCGLGTLYAKTGWREGAHVELSAAIALSRAMEMTFWLPQAEVGLAQVEAR